MAVRDSSAEAKAINDNTGITDTHQQRILDHMNGRTMTRRMIASELGMETASVSSSVNALVEQGELFELTEKKPCDITGRRVYWLRKSGEQLHLF
jgi:DNA-binding MarR family transcriptional regulator